MDRRTIKNLRRPPDPAPPICIDQLVLLWNDMAQAGTVPNSRGPAPGHDG
jgi:hypothetical protein